MVFPTQELRKEASGRSTLSSWECRDLSLLVLSVLVAQQPLTQAVAVPLLHLHQHLPREEISCSAQHGFPLAVLAPLLRSSPSLCTSIPHPPGKVWHFGVWVAAGALREEPLHPYSPHHCVPNASCSLAAVSSCLPFQFVFPWFPPLV